MNDVRTAEEHLLVLAAVAEVGGDHGRIRERLKDLASSSRVSVKSALRVLAWHHLVERADRDAEIYSLTARGRSAGMAVIGRSREKLDRLERALAGDGP